MTIAPIPDMTLQQLVEEFEQLALRQHHALLMDEIPAYNRLYDKMSAVEHELKQRGADERKMLLPLLMHDNIQVRLKAAIATLVIVPEAARKALEAVAAGSDYPQTAEARGMIRALDEGSYIPH